MIHEYLSNCDVQHFESGPFSFFCHMYCRDAEHKPPIFNLGEPRLTENLGKFIGGIKPRYGKGKITVACFGPGKNPSQRFDYPLHIKMEKLSYHFC